MATLHLMVGLPCSGKTTRAKELEKEHSALRLTPDVWQVQLFGNDVAHPDHDSRHTQIEQIMWSVAKRVLEMGGDVILDFGFWSRAEREDFRRRAEALGADFQLHFMDVPEEELFRRLEIRNQDPLESFSFPAEDLKQYIGQFERPAPEELQ